jgi:small subunit ribosomal protein S7
MRGKPAGRRKIQPDAKYNSLTISKMINYIMLDGKKEKARNLVYNGLEKASKDLGVEVKELVDKVIFNVMPRLEVRTRRIGGANYQVPVPVVEHRGLALAMKWIVEACREKQGKNFDEFFAEELIAAYKNEGAAVKKRETTEKMAEANRAYAQFKW